MTPAEAERRIEVLCRELDAARERTDAEAVARIDAEIAELVRITGPRQAIGSADFEIPMPGQV